MVNMADNNTKHVKRKKSLDNLTLALTDQKTMQLMVSSGKATQFARSNKMKKQRQQRVDAHPQGVGFNQENKREGK